MKFGTWVKPPRTTGLSVLSLMFWMILATLWQPFGMADPAHPNQPPAADSGALALVRGGTSARTQFWSGDKHNLCRVEQTGPNYPPIIVKKSEDSC